MADVGCVWLFGHRSKSVDASFAGPIGCTPALSHNSVAAAAVAACDVCCDMCYDFILTFYLNTKCDPDPNTSYSLFRCLRFTHFPVKIPRYQTAGHLVSTISRTTNDRSGVKNSPGVVVVVGGGGRGVASTIIDDAKKSCKSSLGSQRSAARSHASIRRPADNAADGRVACR